MKRARFFRFYKKIKYVALCNVVWVEESKNGIRFKIRPSYDVVPTMSQLVTDGQSSCIFCGWQVASPKSWQFLHMCWATRWHRHGPLPPRKHGPRVRRHIQVQLAHIAIGVFSWVGHLPYKMDHQITLWVPLSLCHKNGHWGSLRVFLGWMSSTYSSADWWYSR